MTFEYLTEILDQMCANLQGDFWVVSEWLRDYVDYNQEDFKALLADDTDGQCQAFIYAGPGHQGKHPCGLVGEHHDHTSGGYQWSDCHARSNGDVFTDYFNQAPGHCNEHD